MAIVSGLVFWLKAQTFKTGKVILLYQPAEETGQGAYKVIEDEKFQKLNTDFVFALHNIPGQPVNSIITMKEGFSAEVLSFAISVCGKESHAAEPENGINPAIGLSEMITTLSKLNIRSPIDKNYTILTPIFINMGEKSYGISHQKENCIIQ
jgi:metal-dependent amidase/aminoacylase/carboxypeptidase family protein